MRDKSLNILLVEDNVGDARLVTELIRETEFSDAHISFTSELDELSGLKANKFDVILLDLHIADYPPTKTYKTVNAAFPKVPIIVLTGLQDDRMPSKIVRLGAQDYLLKGKFSSNTLERSIVYAIERKRSEIRIIQEINRSKRLKTRAALYKDETKRLEGINNAKDTFLSIASHQLRTPASAVKQYLGMILEGYSGKISKEQRGLLNTAYASNERQLRIVEDLLKVAKLDAGHVTLHRSFTDINTLIKDVIDDQRMLFNVREQKIKFIPAQEKAPVLIDVDNMRMVFENLLDNAGKYSPKNSMVTVRVVRNSENVTVEFKDEGIGISAKDSQRLFQKFSRVGDSFKFSPSGSGLGLYWANEIVKLHNGTIGLDSQVGKGSNFKVCIPLEA